MNGAQELGGVEARPALPMGPVLDVAGARVLVGTCSWADATLVKETTWYPRKSMKAAERLAYYAARYPIVEVDSTYYFPPTPELAGGWVERTPADFTMNVKAWSLLTGHPTFPQSLWPDLQSEVRPELRDRRTLYANHLSVDAVDEAWEARVASAAERFRYRYQERELLEWVPKLRALAGSAREVHVLMNNCWRDDAVVNAAELLGLLGDDD